jgi:hypothetical protein
MVLAHRHRKNTNDTKLLERKRVADAKTFSNIVFEKVA